MNFGGGPDVRNGLLETNINGRIMDKCVLVDVESAPYRSSPKQVAYSKLRDFESCVQKGSDGLSQARAGISGDAKHVQEYLCDYRTVVGTLPDRRFGFGILAIIGFRGESDDLRIAKPASFYRAEYNGRSDGSGHIIV
jgi:hypothetical protein